MITKIKINNNNNNSSQVQEFDVGATFDHVVLGDPSSSFTYEELREKIEQDFIDKEEGKVLTDVNYTTEEMEKLDSIEENAEKNIINSVNGKSEKNINLSYLQLGGAPLSHASTSTQFGLGNSNQYGHVKIDGTSKNAIVSALEMTNILPLKKSTGMNNNFQWRGIDLLQEYGSIININTAIKNHEVCLGDYLTVSMGVIPGYEEEPQEVTWQVVELLSGEKSGNQENSGAAILIPTQAFKTKQILPQANENEPDSLLEAYGAAISNSFGNNILEMFSFRGGDRTINNSTTSWGTLNGNSATIMLTYYNCKVDYLSEVEVFGYRSLNSGGCDVENNIMSQLSGFKLNPSITDMGVEHWGLKGFPEQSKTLVCRSTSTMGIDGNSFAATINNSTKTGIVLKIMLGEINDPFTPVDLD